MGINQLLVQGPSAELSRYVQLFHTLPGAGMPLLSELNKVAHAVCGHQAWRLITSGLPRRQAATIVVSVARKLGLSKAIIAYLHLLTSNGRLGLLPDLLHHLEAQRYETVHLATSTPLSDTEVKNKTAALENTFQKPVRLHAHHEPTLLAGSVWVWRSKMMDSSLRSALMRLKEGVLSHV